jgi:tRNA-dihydrouridine synthase
VYEVADAVRIPVCGSGDVVDRASAEERFQGPVSGLFIGRAALWNPLVFQEINGGTKHDLRREPALVFHILERYLALLREEFHDRVVVGRFKQLVSQMCRGYEWRKDLCRAMTLAEQCDILKRARDATFETEAPVATAA